MSLLTRRAMMTHKSGGRLPAGYTEVEYIESTGVQSIRNITFKRLSYMQIRFADLAISGGKYLFGTNSSGDATAYIIGIFSLDGVLYFAAKENYSPNYIKFAELSGTVMQGDYTLTREATGNANYAQYTVIGRDINYDSTVADTWANNKEVALFAHLRWGNTPSNFAVVKIKSFVYRLRGSDTDTYNFVPCVRDSDNKPGFYDLAGSICPLTGTPFYINSGSGADFVAGPPV